MKISTYRNDAALANLYFLKTNVRRSSYTGKALLSINAVILSLFCTFFELIQLKSADCSAKENFCGSMPLAEALVIELISLAYSNASANIYTTSQQIRLQKSL